MIEAVVATLIAAVVVVAVGGLGERLFHHRTTTDSNSAAMSLAERQMEKLLSDPNSDPQATPDCAASPPANLCGNTTSTGLLHALSANVNADGASGGPYIVRWWVTDTSTGASSPLITPSGFPTGVKRIQVTVTHANNPQVNASIVTVKRP